MKNKKGHTIKCLKRHLLKRGEYLLNGKGAINDWWKGHGDAYLRVVDMLNGDITGDDCWFDECVCRRKRIPKNKNSENKIPYTHYEVNQDDEK